MSSNYITFPLDRRLNLIGGEQVVVHGLEDNSQADPTLLELEDVLVPGADSSATETYEYEGGGSSIRGKRKRECEINDVISKLDWNYDDIEDVVVIHQLQRKRHASGGGNGRATVARKRAKKKGRVKGAKFLARLRHLTYMMEIEETAANADDGDDLPSQVSVVLFRGVPHPRTHTRFHLTNPYALPSLPIPRPHHHRAKFATHRRLS